MASLIMTTWSCTAPKAPLAEVQLVPQPAELNLGQGQYDISASTMIYYEAENANSKRSAEFLQSYIEHAMGINLAIAEGDANSKGIVLISQGQGEQEAYQIKVDQERVLLEGSSDKGLFIATQTLRQIIPATVEGGTIGIPAMDINDAPRFEYRGMHLDVGRHFYDVEFIKKFIDQLAFHKMNTFHWHLTEDQGWRIEIKKYPKLTEVGAFRKETIVGHSGRSEEFDGKPYGGFYTQEEVKEVVKYASERFITVIPEIELPGHSLGALAAYPEYGCTGGPYEVATRFGVFDDVFCAGNDKTFEFFQDVFDEVIPLFPSKYIHIGGDECPKANWKKCKKCQARIKKEGLHDEHELQSYFIARIEKYLNSKGRQIIGWDEILEGGLAPNATVMSWRGEAGGIEAAKSHHDVIMTPNSHVYFDHYQSADVDKEPLAIGGFTPLRKVYDYEPIPEELTAEEAKYVKGAQANLWSEYFKTSSQVEYMAFPRMAALAEVVWSPAELKDWEGFKPRLMNLTSHYDKMGINYAKHIFDVDIDKTPNFDEGKMEVKLSNFTGSPIYFTTDGSEPTEQSTLYTEALAFDNSFDVKAVTYTNGNKGRVAELAINYHKASMKPVELLVPADKRYNKFAANVLTDGVRGNSRFDSGDWVGYQHNDMEVVVDLKEAIEVSKVSVGTLSQPGNWIMGARGLEVYVSNDGKTFKKVASKAYPETKKGEKGGLADLEVSFDKTSATQLKVIVKKQDKLPKWHSGAGKAAHLFVDEITVM